MQLEILLWGIKLGSWMTSWEMTAVTEARKDDTELGG